MNIFGFIILSLMSLLLLFKLVYAINRWITQKPVVALNRIKRKAKEGMNYLKEANSDFAENPEAYGYKLCNDAYIDEGHTEYLLFIYKKTTEYLTWVKEFETAKSLQLTALKSEDIDTVERCDEMMEEYEEKIEDHILRFKNMATDGTEETNRMFGYSFKETYVEMKKVEKITLDY